MSAAASLPAGGPGNAVGHAADGAAAGPPERAVRAGMAREPDSQAVLAGPVESMVAAPLRRWLVALSVLLALLALVIAVLAWQKVVGMQENLARQSATSLALATGASALAREAQEAGRDTSARLALAETRIAEVALQRAQLEELMQSLSRSRDDNLVVDIESLVRLALQQAQVTGSVEPLLAALRSASERIGRAAQPRLAPLQRAIAHDADRIRSIASSDSTAALQTVDELMRGVEQLPPLNTVGTGGRADVDSLEPVPADAPFWARALGAIRQEMRSLVRVGRIDRPEAVLLSPDQLFFLRENLKLKLLSVRLALLSRRTDTARSEISSVTSSLNRYFDPASRRVQAAATSLQQLQAQVRAVEPPRIDDTLAALATAAAGR